MPAPSKVIEEINNMSIDELKEMVKERIKERNYFFLETLYLEGEIKDSEKRYIILTESVEEMKPKNLWEYFVESKGALLMQGYYTQLLEEVEKDENEYKKDVVDRELRLWEDYLLDREEISSIIKEGILKRRKNSKTNDKNELIEKGQKVAGKIEQNIKEKRKIKDKLKTLLKKEIKLPFSKK